MVLHSIFVRVLAMVLVDFVRVLAMDLVEFVRDLAIVQVHFSEVLHEFKLWIYLQIGF